MQSSGAGFDIAEGLRGKYQNSANDLYCYYGAIWVSVISFTYWIDENFLCYYQLHKSQT